MLFTEDQWCQLVRLGDNLIMLGYFAVLAFVTGVCLLCLFLMVTRYRP